MDGTYSVSVHHNTAKDFNEARHIHRVESREEIVFCVDAAHMGLGGASCGPAPMEKYRLKPGAVQMRYTICPVTAHKAEEMVEQGRTSIFAPTAPAIMDAEIKTSDGHTQQIMQNNNRIIKGSAEL